MRSVWKICLSTIFVLVFFSACAEALLTPRAFHERRYRPCQNDEMNNGVSATGKFCFRYCAKYRVLRSDISENCIVWKTDIKDLTQENDFIEFRASGFVLINEQRIK
jgi:hypothetical protein